MNKHRATVTIEWHAVNGAAGREVIEVDDFDRLMEQLRALVAGHIVVTDPPTNPVHSL